MQLADGGDDALDLLVAEAEGFGDGVLGDFERAGFDHDDGFFAAGDDDVELAGLLLGHAGIGHQVAFEQAHANGGDGRGERQIGNEGGGGSGGHGDDVGIVFAIGGQDQATICVSLRQASGNSGRSGRSIRREVRISRSEGRPSRLKKPPGIFPAE